MYRYQTSFAYGSYFKSEHVTLNYITKENDFMEFKETI